MIVKSCSNTLNVSEVARILGLANGTIRRWSDNGYLPKPSRVGNRNDRIYNKVDILAFLHALGYGGSELPVRMLKTKKVSTILITHDNSVRRWSYDGLHSYRIGDRNDRIFDPRDVMAYAKKHGYPQDVIKSLQDYIR